MTSLNRTKILVPFIVILIISYFISNAILDYTISELSNNIEIITINSYEAINSMILIYFYIVFILSIPLIYYLLYYYLDDVLYEKEKRLYLSLKKLYILMLFGCFYGYYSAINYLIPFLLSFNTKIDIISTLTLENMVLSIVKNCLLFSIIFLTPIIIKLTVDLEIIEKKTYTKNRKYIYILILILSALLTPPDVLSMIMAAIPLSLLFEIGLFISKNR